MPKRPTPRDGDDTKCFMRTCPNKPYKKVMFHGVMRMMCKIHYTSFGGAK